MTIERRAKLRPVRVEERSGGGRTLSGYAAVFYDPSNPDTEYEMWEGCCERVAHGAFNRAIAEGQDVQCCFNHDEDSLMGRTASKTCRLSVDNIGLKYETDLPTVTDPANLVELIQRGDIPGSSFAFIARSVTWSMDSDGCEVRTLNDVDLVDVGPVTRPAYKATTTAARSAHAALEQERSEWQRKRDQDEVDVVKSQFSIDN